MYAKPKIIFITTTLPSAEKAEEIGYILVTERLAACVHIRAPHIAIYEWEGKLERKSEVGLIIKTALQLTEKVEKRLISLHPYKIPFILTASIQNPFYQYG